MKALIKQIAEYSQMEVKEFTFENLDFCFVYSLSKDDFYVFLFTEYSELFEGKDEKIEYYLNTIINDLQKEETLSSFKEQNLDKNLSIIVVLNTNLENDLLELKKAEENYYVSKKYILAYENKELQNLEKEIEERQGDIIDRINVLAMEKHSLLSEKEPKSWYLLLMRMFTKIPFLNYRLLDKNKKELTNLEETIQQALTEEHFKILQKINDHFDKDTHIEHFIDNNSLLNDNTLEDEL